MIVIINCLNSVIFESTVTMKDTQAIAPILDWLLQLDVITDEKRDGFLNHMPKLFFEELRCGYILSKIAMVAMPSKANSWRLDICSNAKTRYDF